MELRPAAKPSNGMGMHQVVAAIIGLLSGVASGMFGVGGGIVMVPAMIYFLSPPIRDIKQAVGTSLLVIIPTAVVGAAKHWTHGHVEWRTALALFPTALLGGYLGAWLTTRMAAEDLKRAFGGFLILVGLRLLLLK